MHKWRPFFLPLITSKQIMLPKYMLYSSVPAVLSIELRRAPASTVAAVVYDVVFSYFFFACALFDESYAMVTRLGQNTSRPQVAIYDSDSSIQLFRL